MNLWIVSFLAFGALFGVLSFRHQHRFSEGVSAPEADDGSLQLGPRLLWMAVCSCLWPLLWLTGLFGWVHTARRARMAAPRDRVR